MKGCPESRRDQKRGAKPRDNLEGRVTLASKVTFF